MRDVHRLAGVALRPASKVAAHLRHEELEALPLARLRPRRDLGVAVERRVVHPRVHQPVGELREAEDAAHAAVERARVAVDAHPPLDERAGARLTRLDRVVREAIAGGRLIDALDLQDALAAEAEPLQPLPAVGLLLRRGVTKVLIAAGEEDGAAAWYVGHRHRRLTRYLVDRVDVAVRSSVSVRRGRAGRRGVGGAGRKWR